MIIILIFISGSIDRLSVLNANHSHLGYHSTNDMPSIYWHIHKRQYFDTLGKLLFYYHTVALAPHGQAVTICRQSATLLLERQLIGGVYRLWLLNNILPVYPQWGI